MRPLPRGHRLALILWLAVGIIVWNGVYDFVLGKGLKEYLFRAALHDAGRGPLTTIESVMDVWAFDAVWIATLWASFIVLAGLVTIRLAALREKHEGVETEPEQPPSRFALWRAKRATSREPTSHEPRATSHE